MRQCLFCENKADSREHVWPDWILKNLSGNRHMRFRGFIADRPISWQGPKPELKAKFVCEKCNQGWMSSLEGANKPLLGLLMRDIASPIDPSQQRSVARWAIKTAMVFESVVSKHYPPFYGQSQREDLRNDSSLPNHTAIWLARNAGEPEIGSVGMSAEKGKTKESKTFELYVSTIVFGYLAIQIASGRSQVLQGNARIDVRPGPWNRLLVSIWPPSARSVSWPPPLTFSDRGSIAIGDLVTRYAFPRGR